jgi:hypothetical protein
MNSSSAASMMACRRSAARAARPDNGSDDGACGTAGFAAATFRPRRRLAGFLGPPSADVDRGPVMRYI